MELDSPWLFPEKTHCSVGQMGRMCPQEERYPQEERWPQEEKCLF